MNYILNGDHGLKIAVIENEFGEARAPLRPASSRSSPPATLQVNIDEALVAENLQYKEDVISMDNGCVGAQPGTRGAPPDTRRQLRVLHRARRPHQGSYQPHEARQEV